MTVEEATKLKTIDLHNGSYSVYMIISKEERTDPETGRFLPAGKPYIGKTGGEPNDRWRNGKNYGSNELGKDIEVFGWDAFLHIVLYTGLTEQQAIFFENLRTLNYKTLYPNGYNMRLGDTSQYAPFAGNTKPVWRIARETGERLELYMSCASAARVTGISVTSIKDTANGRQEHAGGFLWAFATPEEVREWQQRKRQRKIIA